MRVYLPATLSSLTEALAARPQRQIAPGVGYAVTPGLREWYASGDTEELEYAALSLAAQASVALIAANPRVARRRVVIAAEIPDADAVVPAADADRAMRGMVSVLTPVPLGWVASVHVDDVGAVAAVTAAVTDPDDDFVAGEVADHELMWFANQELDDLVQQLADD